MPIPKTRDVGKTIRFLKKEKPGMPHKQKVAIALSTARAAGANIPKPPKKKEMRHGKRGSGLPKNIYEHIERM